MDESGKAACWYEKDIAKEASSWWKKLLSDTSQTNIQFEDIGQQKFKVRKI